MTTDVKKKLKVISLFDHSSSYTVELVLKKQEITNCLNDPYTVIFKSVDVDSEMDEIPKEAQETTPEGNDASDIRNPKTRNA